MNLVNVLMVGTGEYTTGYVHGAKSESDKGPGVVALTMFDLRQRGLVDRLSMVGTNGSRFPSIRTHLQDVIGDRYRGLDVSFDSFPADDCASDPMAYKAAIQQLSPGDVVVVFTPDDTHFAIAMAAVRQGCHVLVAKPIVKTAAEHIQLRDAARESNVLVAMEVHKRWDPIYQDARDRIRKLGDFSFFSSYMSQPKSQLQTFKSWAGRSSDISYYLNAHHIDFNVWALAGIAKPVSVQATASTGCASSLGFDTEDTITLTVQWQNLASGNLATAVYTSSWIAPRADVHSQQRFFYVGHHGEITVDQAHRGYSSATDLNGYASLNPLFMKYEPSSDGRFVGHSGYGYQSIETFVRSATLMRSGEVTLSDAAVDLATIDSTLLVTAILEAGRRSLDGGGRQISITSAG